ncbi:MAG TPA: copper-binding protein [Burkholderiales bacterium]|nr:copper-binding protein [Burkholderiales bacterium]
MNRFALAVALAFAASMSFAQSGGMRGMDMKGSKSDKKADEKAHQAKGTVSKVDPQAGTVTINHEPVASMNWPRMNMRFKVQDKSLLGKAKQGQHIEFTFVQSGKDYVVTDIK